MKRGIKLLVLLLVLGLLGGCNLLLSKQESAEDEETAAADEAYPILSIAAAKIEEMSWVCNGRTDVFDFSHRNGAWEYIPDTAKEPDNDYISSLADIFATFNAYRELEMPEDLSLYGLDQPYLTVDLKTADGDFTFTFGNMTSVSGRRYCTIGDGKVYTVSSSAASAFNYDLGDIVNLGE
ncbi:MAG: DUF4340 domain-containing protein [Clostridia bacterium]|nr:DUF4340 domain-containing protein [Clostridia bacterium]